MRGHSGGALVTEDGGIVGLVSNVDSLLGESQRDRPGRREAHGVGLSRRADVETRAGQFVDRSVWFHQAAGDRHRAECHRHTAHWDARIGPALPLRSAGATQGRTSMETLHTEVNGTLSVDGVQLPGPASFVSDMKTETQILRVSNGAVTGLRVTFLTTRGWSRAAPEASD